MNEMKKLIKGMIESLAVRDVVQTSTVIEFLASIMDFLDEVDYEVREKKMADVSKLREEYFILHGKKPYLGWSVTILEQKIADEKDKNTMKGDSLSNKKSEWKKE